MDDMSDTHQGGQDVLWKEVEITAVGPNKLVSINLAAGGLKGTEVEHLQVNNRDTLRKKR